MLRALPTLSPEVSGEVLYAKRVRWYSTAKMTIAELLVSSVPDGTLQCVNSLVILRQPEKEDTTIIPILQSRQLKHRKVE